LLVNEDSCTYLGGVVLVSMLTSDATATDLIIGVESFACYTHYNVLKFIDALKRAFSTTREFLEKICELRESNPGSRSEKKAIAKFT